MYLDRGLPLKNKIIQTLNGPNLIYNMKFTYFPLWQIMFRNISEGLLKGCLRVAYGLLKG